MLTLNKHARVSTVTLSPYQWLRGQIKKGQIFKQRQMAKLMLPTCSALGHAKCPRFFFQPTVEGSKVKKGQIFKLSKLTVNMLASGKHAKVSTVTFFVLRFRGQIKFVKKPLYEGRLANMLK